MTGQASKLRRRDPSSDDGGFTVVEVIVAIMLVTIVMTSLAAFFVTSARATDMQDQRQSATRVAAAAIEKARSLVGTGLAHGRDQASSQALWNAGLDTSSTTSFPRVASYLSGLTMAYDNPPAPLPAVPSGSGYTAPLPICIPGVTSASTCTSSGATFSLDNRTFTRNWFLGCANSSSTDCMTGNVAGQPPYLEVVVAVTWNDNGCQNGRCSYVSATTLSTTPDPLFDSAQTAPQPRITNPGAQTYVVGDHVMLPIQLSGGTAPLVWTPPTNLPAGLSWGTGSAVCPGSASGVCIYGTPTGGGTNPVTINLLVTDAFGYTSTATFTWTINSAGSGSLAVTLNSQSCGYYNASVDLCTATLTASGGNLNYSWSTNYPTSAVGVTPSGDTKSVTVFAGPAKGGSYTIIVTVKDALSRTATKTFVWNAT